MPDTPSTPARRLGPEMRSDIVEVYVFRRGQGAGAVEFLQMRRARGAMLGTWHPVMGHVEPGEAAPATARRELREETGYLCGVEAGHPMGVLGLWQLEVVNCYYLASHECIVLSPGFAAEVAPGSAPLLDASHDAYRWIKADRADLDFLWPGQRAAVAQVLRDVASSGSAVRDRLALPLIPD